MDTNMIFWKLSLYDKCKQFLKIFKHCCNIFLNFLTSVKTYKVTYTIITHHTLFGSLLVTPSMFRWFNLIYHTVRLNSEKSETFGESFNPKSLYSCTISTYVSIQKVLLKFFTHSFHGLNLLLYHFPIQEHFVWYIL